jgi:hypothetical protein
MTGVWPLRPSRLFAKDTYGLGGPPALREPCRPKAAGGLELVDLAQGRVIFAGSTFLLPARADDKKILRTRPALSGRKVAIITGE